MNTIMHEETLQSCMKRLYILKRQSGLHVDESHKLHMVAAVEVEAPPAAIYAKRNKHLSKNNFSLFTVLKIFTYMLPIWVCKYCIYVELLYYFIFIFLFFLLYTTSSGLSVNKNLVTL